MALNQALIQRLFPPVEFAFFGNYINRYRRKVLQKVNLPSKVAYDEFVCIETSLD